MSRFFYLNLIFAIFLFLSLFLFFGDDPYDSFLLFSIIIIFYNIIVLIGVFRLDWGLFVHAKCHGHCKVEQSRCVAITFDDGPSEYTSNILNILKKYNARATFFCIGKNLEVHRDIVCQIRDEGHLLGNHSFSHSYLLNLASYSTYRDELEKTQRLFDELIGVKTDLYRPPVGLSNPRMAKVVNELGLRVIGWSIRSLDTRIADPEMVVQRIMKRLHHGAIILLHDRLPHSDMILISLLEALQKNDWTVVALDEL